MSQEQNARGFSLLLLGKQGHYRVDRLAFEWRRAGGTCDVINPHRMVLVESDAGINLLSPKPKCRSWDGLVMYSAAHVGAFIREQHKANGCHIFFHNRVNRPADEFSYLSIQRRLIADQLPVPRTIYGTVESLPMILHTDLTFPLVAKRTHSSGKRAVKLIQSKYELQEEWDTLAQENQLVALRSYHPLALEWRAVVLDGKVVSIVERSAPSDGFLAVFREGAQRTARTEAEVPDVADLAVRAAEAAGYAYCGVDILQDRKTGDLYVIDVNANPIFRTTEAITGVNIAKKLVDYIVETIHTGSSNDA